MITSRESNCTDESKRDAISSVESLYAFNSSSTLTGVKSIVDTSFKTTNPFILNKKRAED